MKKTLILLGILISILPLSVYADKATKRADVLLKGSQEIGTSISRAPIIVPEIYITYDTDASTIEIEGAYIGKVSIVVNNSQGEIVGTSDELNTIFVVDGNGNYSVTIETNLWYAYESISF